MGGSTAQISVGTSGQQWLHPGRLADHFRLRGGKRKNREDLHKNRFLGNRQPTRGPRWLALISVFFFFFFFFPALRSPLSGNFIRMVCT